MNQKSAPVVRLCGLCSFADHYTDLCPSVQQSEAIEQLEAYAANIYNRPPQPKQQNQPQQNNVFHKVAAKKCKEDGYETCPLLLQSFHLLLFSSP